MEGQNKRRRSYEREVIHEDAPNVIFGDGCGGFIRIAGWPGGCGHGSRKEVDRQ
jgi:hypothetical protein